MDSEIFCRRLPKIELHAHLNGSLSPSTLLQLKRYNADRGIVDNTNAFFDEFQIAAGDTRNLADCFQVFGIAHSLTSSPGALELATCLTLQEFQDDGCCYLELRSTPRKTQYMSQQQYVVTILQAIKKSNHLTMITKLIISINRASPLSEAETITDITVELYKIYPDLIVGIELSGNPTSGTFTSFIPTLSRARKAGLKVTLHCGEICNEQEVKEMLDFKPERIGHGVCIHPKYGGNDDIWETLCKSRIPVEVCLTSNVNTKSTPDYSSHHFKELYEAGVPVIICVLSHSCSRLDKAVHRYVNIGSWVPKDVRSNETQNLDNGIEIEGNGTQILKQLDIDLTAPCEEYPHSKMDESYSLEVAAISKLTSDSIWGIMRGLESFAHLFHLSQNNDILVQATIIHDFPRYPHRGLLLDTSRHFITARSILRTLDAMAINKMNVFHWHIVDDQSFPYQSEKFPELSEKGAYNPSLVYSKDEILSIIEYAADRGIRVLPEFDVPGHTRSWGVAYPNILTQCYDNELPSGLGPMDPTNNATYKLLSDLFQEVQGIFPERYFHVGGDEVELRCWESNPTLVQYMSEHNLTAAGLHALFMRNVLPLLATDSVPVVWEEVFMENVTLSKNTLIHLWRDVTAKSMVKVLEAQHKLLFSAAWYLDQMAEEFITYYAADPRQMVSEMGISNKTLLGNIVGGEACMWGEMADDTNVLSRVWPRASAVAEKLWSAETESSRVPYSDVLNRIEEHACRMRRRGIPAQPPSGPGFCIAEP